ncbi:hypothetical protein [Fodinicola feengrottensis]|nr:hypothetical protein [Fodinicola feengrottensis]
MADRVVRLDGEQAEQRPTAVWARVRAAARRRPVALTAPTPRF